MDAAKNFPTNATMVLVENYLRSVNCFPGASTPLFPTDAKLECVLKTNTNVLKMVLCLPAQTLKKDAKTESVDKDALNIMVVPKKYNSYLFN